MLEFELNFVYAIIDEREKDKPPEESSVYVGVTNNPNARFLRHLLGTDENEVKNEWLQGLLLIEPRPIKMSIVEVIYDGRKRALEREKYWVREYERQGYRLTNKRLLAKARKQSRQIQQLPERSISALRLAETFLTLAELESFLSLEELFINSLKERDILNTWVEKQRLQIIQQCYPNYTQRFYGEG